MITLIYLELLRVARDRRFWFWSLVGIPILLPVAIAVLSFAMASLGTVEPQSVKPVIATTATDLKLLSQLDERGLALESFSSRDELVRSLTNGEFAVGLVDVELEPGQPLSVTLVSLGSARSLPIYRDIQDALAAFALDRRTSLMDSLDFDGPSFDLLLQPITLREETAPERLPGGLRQIVTVAWCVLLLFPYLLLTWNGGSRAVTDRLSGYLAPLNASSMPPWKWMIARWSALSIVGGAILLFSAVLFVLYMRAYGTFADWFVSQGVLVNLSEQASATARAYLVDAISLWRESSMLSFAFWLLIAFLQLAAAAALVVWGSVKASSLAQYRLFELFPFTVVFLLPMLGLGALGTGLGSVSWVPGLNTVLSIEHVLTGRLPGVEFLSAAGVAVISNMIMAVFFLLLGALALRNERLWAV